MFLGVDIGGTKCAVVVGDKNGQVHEKIRFETTNVTDTLNNIIQNAVKLSNGRDIKTCGVSCGGPLDEKKGIIMSPPNLPGWDNIPIKQMLEDALSVPCKLRNDANACAVAEWLFGNGKGCENMVFLTFGTGLGSGIILNGKLVSGTNGFAGEVGHIRLAKDGPVGYGKSGSFEGFCSGNGICQLAKIVADKYTPQPEWASDISVPTVADFARNGDGAAKEVFDICGTKLGEGLSVIIDMLNPEKIIIGSIFTRCRDLLEKPMRSILEKETLPEALSVCEILPAGLGESIGDVASLAVAKEIYDELY